MKASDLFVKALEAEGARCVFGLPGEENLDLLESMRASGVRFVVTRHEQAAGFMVNYLYDLDAIERNHEAFAERGEVVAASDLRRLARAPKTLATA